MPAVLMCWGGLGAVRRLVEELHRAGRPPDPRPEVGLDHRNLLLVEHAADHAEPVPGKREAGLPLALQVLQRCLGVYCCSEGRALSRWWFCAAAELRPDIADFPLSNPPTTTTHPPTHPPTHLYQPTQSESVFPAPSIGSPRLNRHAIPVPSSVTKVIATAGRRARSGSRATTFPRGQGTIRSATALAALRFKNSLTLPIPVCRWLSPLRF